MLRDELHDFVARITASLAVGFVRSLPSLSLCSILRDLYVCFDIFLLYVALDLDTHCIEYW